METRTAARLLGGALALGTLAEMLFFGTPLGVNLPIAVAALLACAALARPARRRLDRADLWLGPAALLFAAFAALRTDPALLVFDVPAGIALGGAATAAIGGVPVTRRSVTGLVVLGAWLVGLVASGVARPLATLGPAVRPRIGARLAVRAAAPVLRGLAIALPLLALFALLFAAADAVFARYLGDLLSWSIDLGDLPARSAFALFAAWLAGGLLFAATRIGDEPLAAGEEAVARLLPRPRLGATEARVVLVALDLLFAAFVGLQAAYLFGGRDTLALTGLTYSAYARSGFFELTGVGFLAGGVILALETAVARRTRGHVAAAVALAGLTAIVLVSAALRLRLYQDAYGWTELRFYALAAIAWLGVGIAVTIGALVAGRTRWLLHALAVAGLAVAVAVNLVGPRSFVTGQNVARALDPSLVPPDGETGLDAYYLAGLGDDAVPVLLDALPSLPEPEREVIGIALGARLAALDADAASRSWPAWNLARERARELLSGARARLGAYR